MAREIWRHNPSMLSIAEWYRHKSDQSLRLAKRARDPIRRSNFQANSRLWAELAEQAEADERDILRNGQVGQYSAVDDAALFWNRQMSECVIHKAPPVPLALVSHFNNAFGEQLPCRRSLTVCRKGAARFLDVSKADAKSLTVSGSKAASARSEAIGIFPSRM